MLKVNLLKKSRVVSLVLLALLLLTLFFALNSPAQASSPTPVDVAACSSGIKTIELGEGPPITLSDEDPQMPPSPDYIGCLHTYQIVSCSDPLIVIVQWGGIAPCPAQVHIVFCI